MKTKPNKTKRTLAIVVCVVLAWLGAFVFFTYRMAKGVQFDAVAGGMRCQVRADILDAIESKYKLHKHMVSILRDDTIEIRLEIDQNDQARAFDIAGEIYELKQKSPILSKKPMELKMWVHDPAEEGKRIVYVNPDSKYGINLHVLMPGAPDHKKKRDIEEYRELEEKWREINWQKELDERRAAAATANPSNSDDGKAEERGEDDPSTQETPQ